MYTPIDKDHPTDPPPYGLEKLSTDHYCRLYHDPTPNLFLSSERWPAIVSAAIAAGIWIIKRRVNGGNTCGES